MSFGDKRRGHRSLDTSHSYYRDRGGRGHRYFETSHFSSINYKGYHVSDVGRGGSRLLETRHYPSRNRATIFYVEGRGGYRYQTSHSSSNNPGDCGRLLNSPVCSCRVEEKVH